MVRIYACVSKITAVELTIVVYSIRPAEEVWVAIEALVPVHVCLYAVEDFFRLKKIEVIEEGVDLLEFEDVEESVGKEE